MSQQAGVGRRTFLRGTGLGVLAGAMRPSRVSAGAYDFDTVYDRVGTDCVKWDRQIRIYGRNRVAVGMGIADMDFRAAPAITKALRARLDHENWGYLDMPRWYVDSIVNWNRTRYGVEIKPELLLHSAGVHDGLIAALRAFAPPGSNVIVQSPVYDAFYTDLRLVGVKAEENRLRLVNGRYAMDFEDLERRIGPDTRALILCNPHNPTGNCWSRQDLLTLGEICARRGVVVFADEIHCDFVSKGATYTPFSSLDNETVVRNSLTFKSTSKSFNLAAAKCAYFYTTNPDHIARVKAAGHRAELNTLGVVACRAAYDECGDWLDQVVAYIDGTMDLVERLVAEKLPLVKVAKPQGTYLTWVDVSAAMERVGAARMAEEARRKDPTSTVTPEVMFERYLVEHANVQINAGSNYGGGGAGRMRMNVAAPRKLIELALTNIATALART